MPDGAKLPLYTWSQSGQPRAILLALHGFNDYGKFIEEHGEVYEKFNIMDNKRKTEGIIIDLFRTLEASRRKNNI